MAPIAPEHVTLLRAWIEHIVYGYWTHGGYLNWDTGYGFKRWHAGRTWALAQQGLLAIAAAPRFHNVSGAGRLGQVHVRPRAGSCTSASRSQAAGRQGHRARRTSTT